MKYESGRWGRVRYKRCRNKKETIARSRKVPDLYLLIFPRCTQDMVPHNTLSLMKLTSTRQPYNDVSSIDEVNEELTRMR